jgi:c-di-GMP-binding flagellar brake protein YcgR
MSGDNAVLHNRLMIANNLVLLAKEKCMISAPLGGKNNLLTSVMYVDVKSNALVLDTSPSEKMNELCVRSRRVQFSTVFNGVKVAFTCEKITRTRYNGYDAFLTELPHSLYWFDRRGAFRVAITKMTPATCKITIPTPEEDAKPEHIASFNRITKIIRQQLLDKIEKNLRDELINFEKDYIKMPAEKRIKAKLEREKLEKEREKNPIVPDENLVNVIEMCLTDLSMGGCALMNNSPDYSYFLTPNTVYENCVLVFPEYGQAKVNLEVMLQREIEDIDDKIFKFHEFVGMKFIDSTQTAESSIFRYIQAMDRVMKNRKEF